MTKHYVYSVLLTNCQKPDEEDDSPRRHKFIKNYLRSSGTPEEIITMREKASKVYLVTQTPGKDRTAFKCHHTLQH